MEFLIWIGTALSLLGLLGIILCIVAISKAKKENLSDDALRSRMQKLIPVNGVALLLSVLGLILVVTGIFFSG